VEQQIEREYRADMDAVFRMRARLSPERRKSNLFETKPLVVSATAKRGRRANTSTPSTAATRITEILSLPENLGREFSAKAISDLSGLPLVAVRTALYKTRVAQWRRVKRGTRDVVWKVEEHEKTPALATARGPW